MIVSPNGRVNISLTGRERRALLNARKDLSRRPSRDKIVVLCTRRRVGPHPPRGVFKGFDGAVDRELTRTLDANFNRAREAMRVLEDVARFVWDDAALSSAMKAMRHDLRRAVEETGATADALAWARDSAGDVGREVRASDEHDRADVRDVVTANLRRAMEALRVMEEVAKLAPTHASRSFERLRYRVYDVEKRFLVTPQRRRALLAMRLYVLLTPSQTSVPIGRAAEAALHGGADVLQLRMKEADDAAILAAAREVERMCRERGKLFIVNDRPDLAALADADGVHLGQEDLSIEQARKILPGDRVVGVSTHSHEQALEAERRGADYIGIGPVFPTPIKGGHAPLQPGELRAVLADVKIPHVAIGGINETNVTEVIGLGAKAIAVCRAVIARDDIAAAARTLAAALERIP